VADLGEAVRARAAAHAGLTALVGTRVYPVRLPPGAMYPAVTYFRLPGENFHAHGADVDIVKVRLQVSAWAGSYLTARAVAAQVKAAFSRWRETIAGVEVLDSLQEDGDGIDLYEEEAQVHHVAQDFDVFYRES
jgi:Protein of unknown function (DUF3168)